MSPKRMAVLFLTMTVLGLASACASNVVGTPDRSGPSAVQTEGPAARSSGSAAGPTPEASAAASPTESPGFDVSALDIDPPQISLSAVQTEGPAARSSGSAAEATPQVSAAASPTESPGFDLSALDIDPPQISLSEDPVTGIQSVYLYTGAPGASIRYTVDGSIPSETQGELYQGRFPVDDAMRVVAVVYLPSGGSSEIAQTDFPVSDPPSHGSGGSFQCNYSVRLGVTEEGAAVRYTTDGSKPTPLNSAVYQGEFLVTRTGKVRAVAFQEGRIISREIAIPIDIENSRLESYGPTLNAGVYIGPQSIGFSPDAGVSIRYTTDGSDPDDDGGVVYSGLIPVSSPTTITSKSYREGCAPSETREDIYRVYSNSVVNDQAIELQGDDMMEIVDTYYVHRNNISLSGNARLVIRDSLLVHEKDFSFQYSLEASENSQVVVENSGIGNQCNGSLNWNFRDDAGLTASAVRHVEGCNTWHLFSGRATADITDWDFFGGTTCDNADVTISKSKDLELELCFPAGSVVDEALPTKIGTFSFPNENDSGIDWHLAVSESTIDGWGVGIPPQSDITIRDAGAASVSVIVGSPWEGQTVVLDGLDSKHYADQTWEIVDSTLRLVNVTTYGWEANVFGRNNTIIIRNSNYSGSSISGGPNKLIIEGSTTGTMVSQEQLEMRIEDSVIKGDVVAKGDSSIILVNSVVQSQGANEDGSSFFGNLFVQDNATITLVDTVVEGAITKTGNGTVVVQ